MGTKINRNKNIGNMKNNFKKIKFGQINLNNSKTATATLLQVIKHLDIDILLVQEPYTKQHRLSGFPLRHRIAEANKSEKNKCGIVFVNGNLDCQLMRDISDENIVIANVLIGGRPIHLVSAYPEPSCDLEAFLSKLKDKIRHVDSRMCIICMDSNAHAVSWGDRRTDARGRLVEEWMGSTGFHLLNRGSVPTFDNDRGHSSIDITIVGGRILSRLTNWETSRVYTGSDHALITFDLDNHDQDTDPNKNTRIYASNRIDRSQFQNNIRNKMKRCRLSVESFDRAHNRQTLGKLVDSFMSCITEACDRNLRKSNRADKPGVPWWTAELTILRNRVQAARRRFQRTATTELRNYRRALYRQYVREYKRAIDKAKITSWRSFCRVSEADPFGDAYKLCRSEFKRNAIREPILDQGGQPFADVGDECSHLLNSHFRDDTAVDLEQLLTRDTLDDRPITRAEIGRIFRTLSDKAPGPDGFDLGIVNAIYRNFQNEVDAMYSACFRLAHFPG